MLKHIKKVHDVCPICEDEKDLILGSQLEQINIRKEKIDVEAKVLYCPEGEHYFHDPDDEEEKYQYAYREYRKRKGLLQPEEISQIRIKYGLSQKEFSKFLGFGQITIHRYETGAIQDDAHNNSMFLMQNTETFKRLFKQKKNNLPDRICKKIEKRLREIEDKEQQLSLYFPQPDLKPLFEGSIQITSAPPIEVVPFNKFEDKYIKGKPCEYISQEGELALAA
jgi:putative zinc finger/helix-turn-helix YgiT family protein